MRSFGCALAVAMLSTAPVVAAGQGRPVDASTASQVGSPALEALTSRPGAAATSRPTGPARDDMLVPWAGMLPVQFDGRVMALDTLARRTVGEVAGQSARRDRDPLALLLAWTWLWPQVQSEALLPVSDAGLRQALGLPADRDRFTYEELAGNLPLRQMVDAIRRRSPSVDTSGPSLTALERKAWQAWRRVEVLDEVRRGERLRVVPGQESADAWVTVPQIEQRGWPEPSVGRIRAAWARMHAAFVTVDSSGFNRAADDLRKSLAALGAPSWPDEDRIALEVLYNWVRPVRAAWPLMLAAAAAGAWAAYRPHRWARWVAWVLWMDGLAALTADVLVRWKFLGRVPAATPHESLVFGAWAATLAGIAIMLSGRRRAVLPLVAGLVAVALLVAEAALPPFSS